MGGRTANGRLMRPSREPFTWVASAAQRSGHCRVEERASTSTNYNSFTHTSTRNSSAPLLDDRRRGSSEVRVMAIREDMWVSAARSNNSRSIWYCWDSECGHRN